MSTVLRILLVLGFFGLLLGPIQSQQPGGEGQIVRLDLQNSDKTSDEEEEDLPEVIQFFDNPYEGECFVFCCDRSGSMGWTYKGRIKIQYLKEEMIRAVNMLSSEAEVSAVFFDASMLVFSEQPVPADPAGKQRIIAWVMGITNGHGTCLAPAGVRALAVASRSTKRYRAVIIVTDGIPSCNGVNTQAQCLRDITAANVTRMPVHTVFVPDDGTWEDPAFLQQLAAMNNGSFKIVGQ